MSLPIEPGNYGIDTAHSQIGFAVRHLGISFVRGTFDEFSGSLTVGADLASTSVEIDVQMASVNSGNAGRDGHLQADAFFDTANHPTMTFRSTSIADNGDNQYALTGDLTIRGVTKSVTLDATFNGAGVFPMDQSTHFGFSASGSINRGDFGVSFGIPMASDATPLTLEVQFVKPAS